MKQLEDNTTLICDSLNRRLFSELAQYQTIVENIVFATRQLNMTNARFVEEIIQKHMGGAVLNEVYKFEKVDIGLKACFAALEPTPKEKKFFLQKFLHRSTNETQNRGPVRLRPAAWEPAHVFRVQRVFAAFPAHSENRGSGRLIYTRLFTMAHS